MPKANSEKTGSALNSRHSVNDTLITSLILVISIVILNFTVPAKDLHVSMNGHAYTLEKAVTIAQQEQGLGGRSYLPQDHGMIFIFQHPGIECFWMKNTYVSLDMIWLSKQKRINKIVTNVTPSTYPTTYCPAMPSQYVIELAAGQVQSAGLKRYQTLMF